MKPAAKAAKPQPPHRLTVDIDFDKGEKLNALVKLTGIKKASFIRAAIYREMERVEQERGI